MKIGQDIPNFQMCCTDKKSKDHCFRGPLGHTNYEKALKNMNWWKVYERYALKNIT